MGMIKLRNVSKYYYSKGLIASGISKVNLELNKGEFVIITGESGSGKTTLLNVISGLDSYEDGEMFINGQETSHYLASDFEEYRKKYIGNIFQNYNLINSYTVYQNVELILLINGYKRAEIHKRIDDILQQLVFSAVIVCHPIFLQELGINFSDQILCVLRKKIEINVQLTMTGFFVLRCDRYIDSNL